MHYDNKKHIGYFCDGVNIDHIPNGNAWYIIKILNLQNQKNQIGVGLNLPSRKIGLKDLIKIEDRVLSKNEVDAISLFCVGSSLSIIKNYEVIEKVTISLPKIINSIVICPNERCISHQCSSKFISSHNHHGKVTMTCYYCEQIFWLENIMSYNV